MRRLATLAFDSNPKYTFFGASMVNNPTKQPLTFLWLYLESATYRPMIVGAVEAIAVSFRSSPGDGLRVHRLLLTIVCR